MISTILVVLACFCFVNFTNATSFEIIELNLEGDWKITSANIPFHGVFRNVQKSLTFKLSTGSTAEKPIEMKGKWKELATMNSYDYSSTSYYPKNGLFHEKIGIIVFYLFFFILNSFLYFCVVCVCFFFFPLFVFYFSFISCFNIFRKKIKMHLFWMKTWTIFTFTLIIVWIPMNVIFPSLNISIKTCY